MNKRRPSRVGHADDDAEKRNRIEAAATRCRELPDDAEEIERFEQHRTEELERLRGRWIETRNALYVWFAINACHHPNYPARPLPDWVLEYLLEAAGDFNVLAQSKNPASFPKQRPDESAAAHRTRWEEWNSAPPMLPSQATAMIPRVMRMTRAGWSAFANYYRDAEAADTAFMERYSGMTEEAYAEHVRLKHNLDSRRSVTRRLAKGKASLNKL